MSASSQFITCNVCRAYFAESYAALYVHQRSNGCMRSFLSDIVEGGSQAASSSTVATEMDVDSHYDMELDQDVEAVMNEDEILHVVDGKYV